MANFTVRVELQGAVSRDYDSLHLLMEGEGFRRYLTDTNGSTWALPTAEYSIAGQASSDVKQKALKAANRTHLPHAVLVTESNGRTWDGLKRWK